VPELVEPELSVHPPEVLDGADVALVDSEGDEYDVPLG